MNNPFDDSTHSGNHSLLDDLMQSLNLDSHQHGNPQPSEVVDLSHLHLNLGDTHHPPDLHAAGALDGADASGHSLMPQSGGLDADTREGLGEIKTEWIADAVAGDLAALSTILFNSEAASSQGNSPLTPSDDTALSPQVEATLNAFNYTDSGAITPDDTKSVEFIGNHVWWHGNGWGQAGTVDGHKFYRGGEYIGRLGADLNVYDADGHKIGYVTPSGYAYTPDDRLFATGGTARWAAATLVFNTCTQS